jgi:hypothetical protein
MASRERVIIPDSDDLRRICALPRREATEAEAIERARILTRELRCPGAPRNAALKPWQGYALWEAIECGGLFAGLPVGAGKTLITWLLPIVLGSRNSVLCLPAGLREKTYMDFESYAGVWQTPSPPPELVSYESLTQTENVDLLQRKNPDLLMGDECDLLSNIGDGSAALRIARFMHDDLRVAMLTGTIGRNSIDNYGHMLCWTLKDGCPVPLASGERKLWAALLDNKTFRGGKRPEIGAFSDLGPAFDLDSARAVYKERLLQTPGVVIVDGDSCDQPLTVRHILAPEDPVIDAAYEVLRLEWVTPDGWPLSTIAGEQDPLSMARHAGTLGCGLYSKWDPRPPDWWLMPRYEYTKWVNAVSKRSRWTRFPLDTEKAVRDAYPDEPYLLAWEAVQKRFDPNSVPVWLSGSVVQAARDWVLDDDEGPGLVWCANPAFGRALSAATGLTYYGAKGLSDAGVMIDKQSGQHSAVLSLGANLRGRNLQMFNRNLVINPPSSAKYLEQFFGRTHRFGQERPVLVDYLITSGDVIDAFWAAWSEAKFGRGTYGLTQKILRANVIEVQPVITESNIYRWATREERDEWREDAA